LLGNGSVTCSNGVTVGSDVFYAIRADSYVMQQWKNYLERRFQWVLASHDWPLVPRSVLYCSDRLYCGFFVRDFLVLHQDLCFF
jgi:hypothetical protein